jgi:hypothetical protein
VLQTRDRGDTGLQPLLAQRTWRGVITEDPVEQEVEPLEIGRRVDAALLHALDHRFVRLGVDGLLTHEGVDLLA